MDGADASHGIRCAADDVTQPIEYYYSAAPGRGLWIPAEQICHVKINCDATEKRGRSCLEVSLQDILDYRKYRTYRAALNWARSWFAVVHELPGGTPAQVTAYRDRMKQGGASASEGGLDSLGRDYGSEVKPGAHLFTSVKDGVKMLSMNLQAADAQHDGRMILLSIAAGQGQSETWVTADAQHANYASQAVAESPAVVEMQMWQRFIEERFIRWIFKRVIQSAIDQGRVPSESPQLRIVDGKDVVEVRPTSLECRVQFPALIHRDVDKDANALSQLLDRGVIDARTAAGHFGYDYDQVLENRLRDSGTTSPETNEKEYSEVLQSTQRLADIVQRLSEAVRMRHV